ncbi:MAG TPA: hypothetical protein VM760_05640, partial [Sphingomicrobium sp.]|nr:hypothetical protein [Sphingomicrobium sp.]
LNLNLRLMEAWRRAQAAMFGAPLDVESTIILMAIVAIGTENLFRTDDLGKFEDLSTPINLHLLRKCNLSSIAETTGLNREMVRRRVGKLERNGILRREEDGGVRIADEVLEHAEVRESVRSQLVSMVATLDRLRKDGVLDYPDNAQDP